MDRRSLTLAAKQSGEAEEGKEGGAGLGDDSQVGRTNSVFAREEKIRFWILSVRGKLKSTIGQQTILITYFEAVCSLDVSDTSVKPDEGKIAACWVEWIRTV